MHLLYLRRQTCSEMCPLMYTLVHQTGDVPLISDGLLGCPYRKTSYDRAEVADVDPAYGSLNRMSSEVMRLAFGKEVFAMRRIT